MRTFIALKINIQDEFLSLPDDLRVVVNPIARVKWVDFSNLHLTLFFLGNTNPEQVKRINQVLHEDLLQFSSFTIHLSGLGVFGSNANPKVLWVGVEHSDFLNSIAKMVVEKVEPLGFTPDARGFNPHITIGRIRSVANNDQLLTIIDTYKEKIFQKSDIVEVTLYRSDLTPNGPIYTPLVKWGLCGN
jgi:RNA 2',3'-cyclic 3'-phosphodiesterase